MKIIEDLVDLHIELQKKSIRRCWSISGFILFFHNVHRVRAGLLISAAFPLNFGNLSPDWNIVSFFKRRLYLCFLLCCDWKVRIDASCPTNLHHHSIQRRVVKLQNHKHFEHLGYLCLPVFIWGKGKLLVDSGTTCVYLCLLEGRHSYMWTLGLLVSTCVYLRDGTATCVHLDYLCLPVLTYGKKTYLWILSQLVEWSAWATWVLLFS